MGNGIAHVFAQSGHSVTLVDVQAGALERALGTIARNLDRILAKGGMALSPEISEEIIRSFSAGNVSDTKDELSALSDREFEVFSCIGEGRTTSQIAEALRISSKTVDVHKMNIRAKLGIRDPGELSYFAIRWTEGKKNA